MLLINETILRYGYDPLTLKPKSNKRILYRCAVCGDIRDTQYLYYKESHTCKACLNTKRSQAVAEAHRERMMATAHERVFPSCILADATAKQFGYHPESLAPTSNKLVVYRCCVCKNPKDTRLSELKEGHVCKSCSNTQKLQANAEEMLLRGKSPSGKRLGGLDIENDRRRRAKDAREKYATLKGKVESNMRSALRRAFMTGSFSTYLSYTPQQLTDHIQSRLEAAKHACPMCSKPFVDNNFQIDHRIPISAVDTDAQVKILFEFANLDVLCADCNKWRKAHRLYDYWTNRSQAPVVHTTTASLFEAHTLSEMKVIVQMLTT